VESCVLGTAERIGHTDPMQRATSRTGSIRIMSAVLVAVGTLVGVACTAPAPRGAFRVPAETCADVVLVTARGSSQEVASDETLSIHRRFRSSMAAIAPTRTYRIVEIGDLDGDRILDVGGYPAVGFGDVLGVDLRSDPINDLAVIGGYNESRRVGSEETVSVLAQLTAACPDSRLVVVGTSMGADAIAQGLVTVPASTLGRIDALHLFGDPRFMVGPWMRGPNTKVPSGHGLLGIRRQYVPPGIAARTVSWCGEFDGTCTGLWPISIFQAIPNCDELRQFAWCASRHIDYDYWAHEPAMREAVESVARRAGWAPAT
jgi:pimeloyl-ACP methyl ester carboxylesterase